MYLINESELKNVNLENLYDYDKVFLCKLCETEITPSEEGLCPACIEQMDEQDRKYNSLENILIIRGK